MDVVTQNYRLVLQGADDYSAETREELSDILVKQCGLKVIDVSSLLTRLSTTIKSAPTADELRSDYDALRSAGANVAIVRTWQRSNNLEQLPQTQIGKAFSPREKDFLSFYMKYTGKLFEIMRALDVEQLNALVKDLCEARTLNRQIFIFGNGGSAAVASHLATDMAKQRFDDPRYSFRVMSLNDNSAWMTATANDFGYERVFENQLRNLLQPEDLVIAISSSGNSENVVRAVNYANTRGAITYGIVGFGGGKLKDVSQKMVYIPTKAGQYGYMEDISSIICHMVSVFITEQDHNNCCPTSC